MLDSPDFFSATSGGVLGPLATPSLLDFNESPPRILSLDTSFKCEDESTSGDGGVGVLTGLFSRCLLPSAFSAGFISVALASTSRWEDCDAFWPFFFFFTFLAFASGGEDVDCIGFPWSLESEIWSLCWASFMDEGLWALSLCNPSRISCMHIKISCDQGLLHFHRLNLMAIFLIPPDKVTFLNKLNMLHNTGRKTFIRIIPVNPSGQSRTWSVNLKSTC